MLKHFLLSFFIFITVFISSYSVERKPVMDESTGEVGNFSWNGGGTYHLEELSREITPPAIIPSFVESLPNILESKLERLEINKKRLTPQEIDNRTNILKHTIAKELHFLLNPLCIEFPSRNTLKNLIKFLSKSIVEAHVTEMKYVDKFYTIQNIIYILIYFKRALIQMAESAQDYQKYFGNPQKSARNLLETFTGACIIAAKINTDKDVDMYDCIPFCDPTILFTKKELSDIRAVQSELIITEKELKSYANPILKRIERNFLKLINSKLYIDLENEFLFFTNRILHTATNFKPKDSEKTSYACLSGIDLAYGELAQETLTDSDNWSQISEHSDGEFAESDMSSEISIGDEFENDEFENLDADTFATQPILDHASTV